MSEAFAGGVLRVKIYMLRDNLWRMIDIFACVRPYACTQIDFCPMDRKMMTIERNFNTIGGYNRSKYFKSANIFV